MLDFKAYLRDLIAAKRKRGIPDDAPDVLDVLIREHDSGIGLTEDEILHSSIFMLKPTVSGRHSLHFLRTPAAA